MQLGPRWRELYSLTSPKYRKGLELIHPLTQSKSHLAKFVVRGLQPGDDCWKMLLRLRFSYFLSHEKEPIGPPRRDGF